MNYNNWQCVYCCCTFIFCNTLLVRFAESRTATYEIEKQLLTDLLSDYNPESRPRIKSGETISVKMGLALRDIIKMNEVRQVLTVNVWNRFYWRNDLLVWNQTKYGGIDNIIIHAKQHWKPDIVLYNSASAHFGPTYDDVLTPVTNEGLVTYMYPSIYEVICSLDVRYFPFDQQECTLDFMSWAHDGTSVDLLLKDVNPADTGNYLMNSEWALVKMTAERNVAYYECCPEPYPSVHFFITIRRRVEPYIFYLVFPNIIINLLTIFQFMLPCDSTERITLGITIVLSMIVYLLLVAEMLPMNETLPLICCYFAGTLALVGISLITTFFVLHIHHNGIHDNHMQLPHWARNFILHKLAKLLGMQRQITSDAEHDMNMQTYKSDVHCIIVDEDQAVDISKIRKQSLGGFSPIKDQMTSYTYRILKNLEEFKERLTKQDADTELKCEWQQVAMVIDRLMFFVYLIICFLLILLVFAIRPYYNEAIVK